jgi:hypothetical protein
MMGARRICGCLLGSRFLQLGLVALAALALAGAGTAIMKDLINAVLIALLVLMAGLLAVFLIQVRHSRRVMHPRLTRRRRAPSLPTRLTRPRPAPSLPTTGPVAAAGPVVPAGPVAAAGPAGPVALAERVGQREAGIS